MYFLVLLHEPPDIPGIEVDHEPFVDSLIKQNVILLGGPLQASPESGIWAAYILSCPSRDDAQAIVARDPLVVHGLAVPTVTAAGELIVSGVSTDSIGDLAAANAITIHELSLQRASLEDAFMDLTHDSVEFRAGRAAA